MSGMCAYVCAYMSPYMCLVVSSAYVMCHVHMSCVMWLAWQAAGRPAAELCRCPSINGFASLSLSLSLSCVCVCVCRYVGGREGG